MTEPSPADYGGAVVPLFDQHLGRSSSSPIWGSVGGGGGGMPPELLAKVAVLEVQVKAIQESLTELRKDTKDANKSIGTINTDVATIRENVRHLPTKGFIVTALVTTLVIAGGLAGFAPRIQQWFGTAPPAVVAPASAK